MNIHARQLRTNARILDELDVTLAFATLASELNLVRPTLTEEYESPLGMMVFHDSLDFLP